MYEYFFKCQYKYKYIINILLIKYNNRIMIWNEIPIIYIIGTTGVGKSELGIEICKRFSGEIISADSM